MASSTGKKYVVSTAQSTEVEVEGVTRVERDEQRTAVLFYKGDDLIAEFRGYNGYWPA